MSAVSVGYNGRLESSEAAKFIGCSYSHVIGLIKQKKLKAQKNDGIWMVEYDDANRYKSSFKPRKLKPTKKVETAIQVSAKMVDVKLSIEKEKLDLLALVLSKQKKTVMEYLSEKLTDLHQRIDNGLATIQV